GGQQNVRGGEFLPLTLIGGRIAGACFQRNIEAHLVDRLFEVAVDIDGKGLQRRDVQRMDAAAWRIALAAGGQVDESGQKSCEGLAGAGRGNQKRRSSRLRLLEKL